MDRSRRLLASLGLLLASVLAIVALLAATPGSLRANLSWSRSNNEPVWQAIADRLPASIELVGAVADITGAALLLEVILSFFGFGVQPPAASLGNMLFNAQSNLTQAPWAAITPLVVIVVLLFALYALGEDLRERASS